VFIEWLLAYAMDEQPDETLLPRLSALSVW